MIDKTSDGNMRSAIQRASGRRSASRAVSFLVRIAAFRSKAPSSALRKMSQAARACFSQSGDTSPSTAGPDAAATQN